MHLNISQQMKMSQQMKLAPRMIQSMEILQLPLLALQERIDQELVDNIVLENVKGESGTSEADSVTETAASTEEPAVKEVEQAELVVDSDSNNEADFERLVEIAADWPEDNIGAGSRVSSNRMDDATDRQHDLMANMVCRPQSLHEYLLEQYGFFN
ncbi:MAG: RNA polymerase sigma-54 factor, partial [Planctomycetaceae bacterium]